jgi:predicted transcriptional regulator
MPTTTLKLPDALKARVASLAAEKGRSPHALTVEAIERHVDREERMRDFVREALAAERDIADGGAIYAAEDVHEWIDRFSQGEKPPRPKPWRG